MLMGHFLMEPGFKFNLGFFGASFFSARRSFRRVIFFRASFNETFTAILDII